MSPDPGRWGGTAGVARGVSWVGAGHVAGQLAWYASLLFIAALVPPRSFGSVAVAMVVVQIAWLLVGSGTRGALVLSRRVEPATGAPGRNHQCGDRHGRCRGAGASGGSDRAARDAQRGPARAEGPRSRRRALRVLDRAARPVAEGDAVQAARSRERRRGRARFGCRDRGSAGRARGVGAGRAPGALPGPARRVRMGGRAGTRAAGPARRPPGPPRSGRVVVLRARSDRVPLAQRGLRPGGALRRRDAGRPLLARVRDGLRAAHPVRVADRKGPVRLRGARGRTGGRRRARRTLGSADRTDRVAPGPARVRPRPAHPAAPARPGVAADGPAVPAAADRRGRPCGAGHRARVPARSRQRPRLLRRRRNLADDDGSRAACAGPDARRRRGRPYACRAAGAARRRLRDAGRAPSPDRANGCCGGRCGSWSWRSRARPR